MLGLFYDTLISFGRCLSFEQVESAGGLLGRLLWTALPGRRKLAIDSVAERLGLEREAAAALIRRNFQHTCRSFLESALTPRVDWRFVRDRLEIATPERLALLQADRTPIVFPSGHFGAWELVPRTFKLLLSPERRQCFIVRRNRDQTMHEALLRLRAAPGTRILEHRQSAFSIARELKRGGACGFLVDHNCRRDEAVFLPFLGKVAAVNMGPALLAVRTNATVWPVSMIRKPGPRYVFHLGEPCAVDQFTGEIAERVAGVAAFYTAAVEDVVRAHPEQWFWMHNRWKTRPADEA